MKYDSSDISVTGHRYELDDWSSEKRNFSLCRHCPQLKLCVQLESPIHNIAGALSPCPKSSEDKVNHSLPLDSELHPLMWCLICFTRSIAAGSHQRCDSECTTPSFNSTVFIRLGITDCSNTTQRF
jgi:hypothetical protein